MKSLFLILTIMFSACAHKNVSQGDLQYLKSVIAVNADQIKNQRCQDPGKTELAWSEKIIRANVCWKQRKLNTLNMWANLLIEQDEKSPWGMFYRSLVEFEKKNYELSLWLIERSLENGPQVGLLLFQKARVFWELGQASASVLWAEKALNEDKQLTEALLFLGRVARMNHQGSQAKNYFQRVLEIDPQNKAAVSELQGIANGTKVIIGGSVLNRGTGQ